MNAPDEDMATHMNPGDEEILRKQRATVTSPSLNKELVPGSFRKKPVVITAVQYTEAVRNAYLFDGALLPAGVRMGATSLHPGRREVYRADAYIETLEGRMAVSLDDWIITGVKGEHYPCKPDIFAATYEPASTPSALHVAPRLQITMPDLPRPGIFDPGRFGVGYTDVQVRERDQQWLDWINAALGNPSKAEWEETDTGCARVISRKTAKEGAGQVEAPPLASAQEAAPDLQGDEAFVESAAAACEEYASEMKGKQAEGAMECARRLRGNIHRLKAWAIQDARAAPVQADGEVISKEELQSWIDEKEAKLHASLAPPAPVAADTLTDELAPVRRWLADKGFYLSNENTDELVKVARAIPAQPAEQVAEPVCEIIVGGLAPWGKAAVFKQWLSGKEGLPDGNHLLYLATPAPQQPVSAEAIPAQPAEQVGEPSEEVKQRIVAAFLEQTGQYVTNDASREAALTEAYAEGWQDGSSETVNLLAEKEPRLIGWRSENYLWETTDPKMAKSWKPNVGVLPIFEGDPNTKLAPPAPQQPVSADTARMDWLQQRGATVEILVDGPGTWQFRIGGLRKALHRDIRQAIDAAAALTPPQAEPGKDSAEAIPAQEQANPYAGKGWMLESAWHSGFEGRPNLAHDQSEYSRVYAQGKAARNAQGGK